MSNHSCLTQVFAKARLFEASKRWGHISLVVGVDKDGASVEPFADIQSFADVPCKNTWCQAVLCSIGSPQNIVHLTEELTQTDNKAGQETAEGKSTG